MCGGGVNAICATASSYNFLHFRSDRPEQTVHIFDSASE